MSVLGKLDGCFYHVDNLVAGLLISVNKNESPSFLIEGTDRLDHTPLTKKQNWNWK